MRAFVIMAILAIIIGYLAVQFGWTEDVADCTYDATYHKYTCPEDK